MTATAAVVSPDTKIEEVNARLQKGQGWIGYRYSKSSSGEKVRSRFLYIAFYQGSKQKFVRTDTNDAEEAYRQLLETRHQLKQGDRILPSDVSKLRYEDLRKILMDYYRGKHPASMYVRPTGDGGTEETFSGADALDAFFKRLPITEITALKIQDYIKSQQRKGIAGPTIRRQLGRLRSAFNRAKDLDLITDNHIPSFNMPADSKARKGFLPYEEFEKLRAAMPAHLHLLITFMYLTGCRIGAAMKITWAMVSKNCDEIDIAAEIMKTDEPLTLPLAGDLEEIATELRKIRKAFPNPDAVVFDSRNFRKEWKQACHDLGLGTFDKKTGRNSGLRPHDFRRSAVRNLRLAGVDEQTAMRISGHKTTAVFRRYNIQTTEDVKNALIKVSRKNGVNVVDMPKQAGR